MWRSSEVTGHNPGPQETVASEETAQKIVRSESLNRAGTTMGEQSVSAVTFWRGSGGWGRGEVCPGVVGLKPNHGSEMHKK